MHKTFRRHLKVLEEIDKFIFEFFEFLEQNQRNQ